MAQVFFPQISKMVPASAPHPPETEYKVSIGAEVWEGQPRQVIKIQMVYKGKIAGKIAPSFPICTGDYEKVQQAVKDLLAQMNVTRV